MTRTIPHRELRNNSSAVLRDVREGETIEITNHGEVVAVLSPPEATNRGRCAKPASRRGGFAQLPLVELDHPVQDTLDELRAERL